MNRDYHILSVSELTFQIKELMEGSFTSVWIEGEMSNFLHHRSGHMYFTLKDDRSELRSVMFRGNNQFLRFKPENGMKIVAQGKISVYEQRGQYQLMVQQMEQAGIGTLYLAFEALKKQLSEEGLFDLEWKKEIPPFPKTVGIITSSSGAAIQDIIKVLGRRAPHVQLILRPTLVQGAEAAEEIVQAIEEFQSFQNVDVLIVGRGGGSLEDLWPFNEETVARAVFSSQAPVISAVGHETDHTICDLVADLRAATPSAAAELAVPDRAELAVRVASGYQALGMFVTDQISRSAQTLNQLKTDLDRTMPDFDTHRMRLDDMLRTAEAHLDSHLNITRERVEGTRLRLESLNPADTLRRGYAIVERRDSGAAVTDADDVAPDDVVRVRVSRGSFDASVID